MQNLPDGSRQDITVDLYISKPRGVFYSVLQCREKNDKDAAAFVKLRRKEGTVEASK